MTRKFRSDFAKILAKVDTKMQVVTRAYAVGVAASLINRSPVLTGRFKGNWLYGVNGPNTAVLDVSDRDGAATQSAINTSLASWKLGQTIFITNSLPYAKRLENGWSKQAPQGMVKLAVLEFKANVANIARSIK